MKKRTQLILLCIVAFIAAGGFIYTNNKPLPVDTIQAEPQYVESYFKEKGNVVLTDDYNIYSPVEGKVLKVFVQKGDKVEAGTPIAQIETKDYLTQIQIHESNIASYRAKMNDAVIEERNIKDEYADNLNRLNARLSQIKAETKVSDTSSVAVSLPNESLKIIDISIEQSQIERDYQQDLYNKNKVLYEAGAISQAEFNSIEQSLKAIEKKLEGLIQQKESSEQELERISEKYGDDTDVNSLANEGKREQYDALVAETEAQIVSAQKNMGKDYKAGTLNYYEALIKVEESNVATLKDTINDCLIVANESGTITELPVKNMSIAYSRDLLCEVKRMDANLIESFVVTDDAVFLNAGDKVELIQKTRDKDIVYTGMIQDISSWATEKVSALGMIEQRVKVTIKPNEDLKTAGGGYGLDVKYTYYKDNDRIVLPNSAFFKFRDGDYVFMVQSGKAVLTPVTRGSSSGSETVIEQGINPGDIVIKNASAEGLKEGAKVSSLL